MPTSFSMSGWITYTSIIDTPGSGLIRLRPADQEQEIAGDGDNMPVISVVDGEIIIRNPSTFMSIPQLCTNTKCPRMNECLRSIGNINMVGRPTKENPFIHSKDGCAYFIPRTPEHISQLRERGVNELRSAWHM